MKSCLSIILAFIILIAFLGTAAFLWYGSNTTEFSDGPFSDTPQPTIQKAAPSSSAQGATKGSAKGS